MKKRLAVNSQQRLRRQRDHTEQQSSGGERSGMDARDRPAKRAVGR
jgi:hypothetical protein